MTYKSRIKPSRIAICFNHGIILAVKCLRTTLGLLVVLGIVLAVLGKIEHSKGIQRMEGYNLCEWDILRTIEAQENMNTYKLAVFSMNGRDNRLAYVTPLKDWRNE